MFQTVLNNKAFYILLGLYIFILGWWLNITTLGLRETPQNYVFGVAYCFIALFGGVYGLFQSRIWGGLSSVIGRSIIFFSLGLLGQFFGQAVWSYYNIVAQIEVPYPSIADIGFFSIIPFYILGMLMLAKASYAKKGFKGTTGKLYVVAIPILMVVLSYILFLKDIPIDVADPVKTFLDFGYPIGEAAMISVALITYSLSKKILGGHMRSRILWLIFAMVFQFVTETTFLYQSATEQYYNAGIVDLMYATSFFIMSIGLISMHEVPDN